MATVSDRLTPRSAAQTLQDYQDNHQIEIFMQEMMSVVCTILPEDPYEYMMNHVVSRRPAPPPSETELCGSGALWVLLKEGDPLNPEHWRLRRCWLTSSGTFCLSTEPATVTKHGAMLKMTAPRTTASAKFPIEVGGSFRELDEDEAVRPFAFALSTGGKQVCLAAGSEEQRDEWFNLLGHFADADRRKGPLPKSAAILSPRTSGGGTQVVDAISAADVPIVIQTKKAIEEEKTLKPILKTKPSQPSSSPVPAIRIPRRMPADPMEASGLTSTRRSSIRFSDEVEKREFAVQRADPVPQNLRAHESRRKPQIGTVPVAEPEVPERPEQPANREEQVTSRSMGRLSATQSEICRDVNNDAAFNLVTDIFAESLTQADEEAKKKADAEALKAAQREVQPAVVPERPFDRPVAPKPAGGQDASQSVPGDDRSDATGSTSNPLANHVAVQRVTADVIDQLLGPHAEA